VSCDANGQLDTKTFIWFFYIFEKECLATRAVD